MNVPVLLVFYKTQDKNGLQILLNLPYNLHIDIYTARYFQKYKSIF